MKHFIILLAKGIAIAILAALFLCYVAWSVRSYERVFWCGVFCVFGFFSFRYLIEEDFKQYKDSDGHIKSRKMTKIEQVGILMQTAVGISIFSTFLWLIGCGVSSLFDLHVKFWEMYFIYGLLYTVGCIVSIVMLCSIASYIGLLLTSAEERRELRRFLMWLIVVVCSLTVAVVILYHVLPLIVN